MEKFHKKAPILIIFAFSVSSHAFAWGFFGHKNINRLAVFTLPPEMIVFYKKHLGYIEETSVLPDKRRYAIKEEAPRHFIDLDTYEDVSGIHLPYLWKDAVAQYTEDSLMKHGILPWHLALMKYRLTEAFKNKDEAQILKLSAELGHYIADGNVPLHTCSNYNGQKTGQHGIHGLWESRLPELFFSEYDFFTGPAQYLRDPQKTFWDMILASHAAVDSVLSFEKALHDKFSEDKKYAFEERGGTVVKVYSKSYCEAYHKMLNGQVERQMRSSVKMVGNIWYTCWVDAGMPDLNNLDSNLHEEDLKEVEKGKEIVHDNCSH